MKKLGQQQCIILLYHRVAELHSDPWSLAISPRYFAEHLEVLREYAEPIKLQQLGYRDFDTNLRRRNVIVTFDDGYADLLYNAKPLLEQYEIPATVFITSGYLGREREFWWDELEQLLLQSGVLPEKLSITVNGTSYQWKTSKAPFYSREHIFRRLRYWRGGNGAHDFRHRLYFSLWNLLYSLPESKRQETLAVLREWAGVKSACRPTHRPLSIEEMGDLLREGLIVGGSHTVTHTPLAILPWPSQQEEIQQSKVQLEEIVNYPVYSFSYPHHSLSNKTVYLVKEAGYRQACSGPGRWVDNLQMPRIPVQNCDGEEFARQLSRWLG